MKFIIKIQQEEHTISDQSKNKTFLDPPAAMSSLWYLNVVMVSVRDLHEGVDVYPAHLRAISNLELQKLLSDN